MANTATRRKQHEFVDRLTFSIVPVAPFRLDLTTWALRRRRQNIIDRWDGSTYRRILPFGNVPIEVAVTQSGPCDAPRLQVTLTGPGLRPEFKEQTKSRMEKILGLRVDLAPFYRMPAMMRNCCYWWRNFGA